MKAPQKARAAHAQKSKDGTLTQGVVVPFRTAAEKAQKFLQWKQKPTPEITDKVRLSRARMAAQGLPASGGYHTPKQEPGEPTPQRRAKNNRAPLQPYSGKWPPEVEIAFARFLVEAEHLSQYSPRVTIGYDSNGGGSNPANRNGGLGHVPDKIRELHRRFNWVRRNLSMNSCYVLDKLVLSQPYESNGNCATLSEVGHLLFPAIRDVAMARGISLGFLLSTGEQLADLYAYYEREYGGR
jgi:hypothetical protein